MTFKVLTILNLLIPASLAFADDYKCDSDLLKIVNKGDVVNIFKCIDTKKTNSFTFCGYKSNSKFERNNYEKSADTSLPPYFGCQKLSSVFDGMNKVAGFTLANKAMEDDEEGIAAVLENRFYLLTPDVARTVFLTFGLMSNIFKIEVTNAEMSTPIIVFDSQSDQEKLILPKNKINVDFIKTILQAKIDLDSKLNIKTLLKGFNLNLGEQYKYTFQTISKYISSKSEDILKSIKAKNIDLIEFNFDDKYFSAKAEKSGKYNKLKISLQNVNRNANLSIEAILKASLIDQIQFTCAATNKRSTKKKDFENFVLDASLCAPVVEKAKIAKKPTFKPKIATRETGFIPVSN